MKKNRRRHPRATIRWPVTILTPEGPKHGETKNISVGGALVTCAYPLALHDRFCVIFRIPNHPPISVNTVVARTNYAGERTRMEVQGDVALYYTGLSDNERQILHAKVSQSALINELETLSMAVQHVYKVVHQQAIELQKTATILGKLDGLISRLTTQVRRDGLASKRARLPKDQ
ncbi:MAG: PilZ domain-containing protein [Deltaproteobacteria bacterium]|nr:PilZ domain-containing protein [Deltaproteobacteria bacterium]MBW2070038.1 PilZ domain-containing protein [Deltaproteobacteria bacterium]